MILDWYSGKKGFVHEQKAIVNQTEDIVAEWENCNPFDKCDDEIKTQLVNKYSIQVSHQVILLYDNHRKLLS